MFRHNFLLIYRNYKRFRNTFFINLIGLSTGLACSFLIYLWVSDEVNIDKFHEKDTRLYQLMESQQHAGDIRTTNSTPGLLAETLIEEMPEVEYATTVTPFFWFDKFTLSVDENNIEAIGQYAGRDFFNIFSYGLFEGDKNQVLSDKNSIVISESLAEKLFGTTRNLIGKSIEFQHKQEFLITGIFKDVPTNSSERFDFVLSFELYKDINPGISNWGNSGPNTFVVLKEGSNADTFNEKVEDVIKSKHTDTHRTLFITPYSDNYLYGNYQNGVQTGGRIEYVRLFSIIAVFILLIACINFMNLSTAKASRRAKEVGIKKAIGADRKSLIFQFLGESLFMSILSLIIAVLLIELLLPQFNQITGKELSLVFSSQFIFSALVITLITAALAGSYPAFYLSGFKPVWVLKGKLKNTMGEVWARKGLVVFQFTLSIILMVAVVVVYKQINFLQTKNLGYDKDNTLYFEREGRLMENMQTFISEVKNIPGVINASSIGQSMVGGGNTTEINWEGKNPEDKIPFAVRPFNYGIIEMLDIEIVAGRSFSPDFSTDSTKVIFNETGIEAMGLKNPLGATINLGGMEMEIIGVARDFYFESLRENVSPMFFVLMPQYTQKIMVKIEAGMERETINKLQEFYESYNPGFVFEYKFLDDDYQAQYIAEQRVAILSKYFAGLAIIISCLGLFGLAAFTAERRIKEIGIRKILGSSEFGIIYLLSKDFTKMILAAILLGLPVSYIIIRNWLDDFAYKIPLEVWYFLGAGVSALLVAWITVGMQAVKAALVNPAVSLRNE